MGENKLISRPAGVIHQSINLVAEEGTSLSSGSLRLYAICSMDQWITPQSGENIVGCVDLYNYDPLNRRAAVGIMVASEHRRQGHALAMLEKLNELFLKQVAGSRQQVAATGSPLHCLYADIAATNTASLALFTKAGYTECGLFRQWLNVNDQYIDSIRMQKIL